MVFLLILSGNERVPHEQSMILGGEWNKNNYDTVKGKTREL